jgi:hypothetical protein
MTRFAAALFAVAAVLPSAPAQSEKPFGVRVVDDRTGRGVPLVELRTTNDIAFHTDSGGWVAFDEPGLLGKEVFFAVASPGYEYPKDGFGYRGVRLTTSPGKTATVKVSRTQPAERLYRVTGQGVHHAATRLGLKCPIPEPNLSADVTGQDSLQCVPYNGKLFWLWGDTNRPSYPLGNFQTTAAMSPMPGKDGFDIDAGVPLTYFTDPAVPGTVRHMVPLKEPGVVWLFGLLTVPDGKGNELLLAHFSRRKSLAVELEHGLVRFDDAKGAFEKIATLDPNDTWRHPSGNAVRDGEYVYFASPFCHTRVTATYAAVTDPAAYEALTVDPATGEYRWQVEKPPTTQADEEKWIRDGTLKPGNARYRLTDAAGNAVAVHGGSIEYSTYRKRWVLIAVERGGRGAPSALGEVWYAEAASPAGPWQKAVKVATHPKYSFYNPRQHPTFAPGGRHLYFEGTYTTTFSGNPNPTPRYEYNQLLYRLDLDDPALAAAR